MNKISMDALNNGWNLGVGTRIRSNVADFDCAVARAEVVVPTDAPIQLPISEVATALVQGVYDLFATFVRRNAQ